MRVGDAVLLAPEHTLSLLLKCKEMQLIGQPEQSESVASVQPAATLGRVYDLPSYTLYDESDEILRYRYQLIYAVGRAVPLSWGSKRWRAVQALLWVLKQDARVQNFL